MSLPTLYEHYTGGGISAGLSADQPYFTLNNKNITLFSGALHYFRVPQEYWRDRLRKMRAAGLNTVETYIPWNLHEPEPGVYDFGFGGSDFQDLLHVEKFLKIAQEEDLFAIVRPGPYICSEWEYGGLPSWLLREKGMKVRTSDEKFMGHVERYFKVLFAILTMFQFTKGGPIISFQIENEFGSMGIKEDAYLNGLKKMFVDGGLTELFVTSDGPSFGNLGQIDGVLYTGNFDADPEDHLDIMKTFQKDKPSMVMEYWSGWYDHWAEKHHKVKNDYFADIFERILKYPSSINLYMFHGGTSFGFMNGANIMDIGIDNDSYKPDTNSYDYDAPLNENGDYTDKYYITKELIEKYNDVKTLLPEEPALTPRIAYENITEIKQISFDEALKQAPHNIKSDVLLPMELLDINNGAGQSYGYIVYRKTNLNIPQGSTLKIGGRVTDSVFVLINGELKSKVLESQADLDGFGFWKAKDSSLYLGDEAYEGATLELVVENWARNNFGLQGQFEQYKGIWQGNVSLNEDNPLEDWELIPLEFKTNWTNSLSGWESQKEVTGPALYKAILEIEGEPKDTYIDMRDWNTGIIIANGFVLSRHMRLGPQQSVYLPGPFLKQGKNEIVIFEHFKAATSLTFSDKQIFETRK
ncbi:PREDICTED: beta-galactosidase-1-like protein 2 [Nicrophorus vespilloides]|uniref:Beta-galactosidase n=1 Tax=Nicrophorus vespilloides TaxID=110193 RepID=A0ABM1NGE8_NICVS|nr:PREDICTED: beta-galactosidase-1-like protein 2 [Nicrophorus vespilloides]